MWPLAVHHHCYFHSSFLPVELDGNSAPETRVQYNTILTEVAATASSMSPDTNHNELSDNAGECFSSRMNGVHKEAAVPEELLQDKAIHRTTGIAAADVPSEAKTTSLVEQDGEDEERIQEYLQRSDTAVIYPEPVGRPDSGKYNS